MAIPPLSRDTPSADMIMAYRIHLVAAHRSPQTVKSAIDLLFRLDRELPCGLAEAYAQELKTWLAREHWSASAKATYRAHIVGFFEWACDEDDPWLTYNPARRLPRPRVNLGVADPVPDDELRLCVGESAEQPWRLICILAAYAGLRPCEIAAACREDVTERWIKTVGKGSKPAVVPTEPPVWRAVRDLPPGVLIRRPRGQAAYAKWISEKTAKYLREIVGVDTTLRHLRHWHGTWLRRHYDLRTVQERMRHANLRTTQVYTAVTQAELLSSVGALPDFTTADAPTDLRVVRATSSGLGDTEVA